MCAGTQAQYRISSRGELSFAVSPQSSTSVPFELEVTSEALPENRQSARFPLELEITSGAYRSSDTAEVYVLPTLEIPRLRRGPVVDGELSDMEGFARGVLTPEDLWWRKEPSDPSDASASFHVGYDQQHGRLFRGEESRLYLICGPELSWRSESSAKAV